MDPRVLDAMLPYLKDLFGNAASRDHKYGWEALEGVELARAQVASLIGATAPSDILFTSGATESDNLAILGIAEKLKDKGRHIITGATEHHAVLDPCRWLEDRGWSLTILPVDSEGKVRPQQIEEACTDDTVLISLMYANNEIGTYHPVADIGAIAKEKDVLFHCDASQAMSWELLDVDALNIDLLSFSAHKMYGPKGIGALYLRSHPRRVTISPLFHGGGHERGLRSGTQNVPAIIGFGKSAELVQKERSLITSKVQKLRTRLWTQLEKALPDVQRNGSVEYGLPNNLSITFTGIRGDSLLTALHNDVAVSSGAACASAQQEVSYVLKAIGLDDSSIHSTLRFGLGKMNTQEEVDFVADRVIQSIHQVQQVGSKKH